MKFADEVDAACDRALARHGFESRQRGYPLLAIDKDTFGWVGLNRVKEGAAILINPFVGLHSVPVMRLCSELKTYRKQKYKVGQVATVAIHLGELAPEVTSFYVEHDNFDSEATRLAVTVAEYGVPWMKANANLEAMLELLREREGMLGGFPERVAVVLFLLKRYDELFNYLDSRREFYKTKPNWLETREEWDQFSNNLRNLIPDA